MPRIEPSKNDAGPLAVALRAGTATLKQLQDSAAQVAAYGKAPVPDRTALAVLMHKLRGGRASAEDLDAVATILEQRARE